MLKQGDVLKKMMPCSYLNTMCWLYMKLWTLFHFKLHDVSMFVFLKHFSINGFMRSGFMVW